MDTKWLALGAGAAVLAGIFFWPKKSKAQGLSNSSAFNLTDVSGIQKALTALGYSPGKVDGKYGPTTKAAVVAFQKAHSLNGDAVVGHDTRAAMAKDLKSKGMSVTGESGPTIRGIGLVRSYY